MSKFDLNNVSQTYMDVFCELGNIGAGNAATALAHMLNIRVDMSVPKVELLDFSKVGETIGGEDKILAGVYLAVTGDITGSIMFLLEPGSAKKLLSMLLNKEIHDGELDEIEKSALMEIGNIITASYLNSLSSLTRLTISPSVPSLSIDMAAAILSVPAIEFGIMSDKLFLIQTAFSDGLDGFFILIPDMDSYDKILESIGM